MDGFIFYKSFYDAVKEIEDPLERLAAIEAVLKYGIEGEEVDVTGVARMFFIMAKPQIDANRKRKTNGLKGGRPSNSETETGGFEDEKPMVFETETNGFENEKPKEKEKVKEKEKEKDKEKGKGKEKESSKDTPRITQTDLVNSSDLSEPVKEKLIEWLAYKKERREGYKETGLRALISEVYRHEQESGSIAVINLISECMASGWRGIIWDRLKPTARSGTSALDEWARA